MWSEVIRTIRKRFHQGGVVDAKEMINFFHQALIEQLPDKVEGLYIVGSYALNECNPQLSDLDFMVTLKDYPHEETKQQLLQIHRKLEQISIQPNFNGIYARTSDVGKTPEELQQLTYFHEGQLHTVNTSSRFYEINPITWAELTLFGQTVFGTAPSSFNLTVNWTEIAHYMHTNINSYWQNWLSNASNLKHPYFYQLLCRASDNAWCVSGVARQLFTLLTNQITSKRLACVYFLDNAPVKYHQVLNDTIQFREGKPVRMAWQQKTDTLVFMAYCIREFNANYQKMYAKKPLT